jgi:hypothetical protein
MANFPTASLNAAVNGIGALVAKFSLHSANPSTTGANELAGGAYARVAGTVASASGGVAHPSADYTLNVPAGSTVAYFGMWTSGDVWVGGGPLSASESYTGAGTYTLNAAGTTITATSG